MWFFLCIILSVVCILVGCLRELLYVGEIVGLKWLKLMLVMFIEVRKIKYCGFVCGFIGGKVSWNLIDLFGFFVVLICYNVMFGLCC